MRKKSKPRTLSNHLKPTKLHPRSAGNVDVALGRRNRLRRVERSASRSPNLAKSSGLVFSRRKNTKAVNRVGVSRLQQITGALGVDMTFFYDGNSKAERKVDSLLFLDSSFTLRLLRAYTAKIR
jgi:hypothetical protein